jgi:hypothetical protein
MNKLPGSVSPRLSQRSTDSAEHTVDGRRDFSYATDCRECDEGNKKRIFNQVLAVFTAYQVPEIYYERENCFLEIVLQLLTPLMSRSPNEESVQSSCSHLRLWARCRELAIDLPVARQHHRLAFQRKPLKLYSARDNPI